MLKTLNSYFLDWEDILMLQELKNATSPKTVEVQVWVG